MTAAPVVSVITNFLNEERFITEAVESVISQTYESWELLLVDDGSDDASSEIARRYASRRPNKIRYFEHAGHVNLGSSAARNLQNIDAFVAQVVAEGLAPQLAKCVNPPSHSCFSSITDPELP